MDTLPDESPSPRTGGIDYARPRARARVLFYQFLQDRGLAVAGRPSPTRTRRASAITGFMSTPTPDVCGDAALFSA